MLSAAPITHGMANQEVGSEGGGVARGRGKRGKATDGWAESDADDAVGVVCVVASDKRFESTTVHALYSTNSSVSDALLCLVSVGGGTVLEAEAAWGWSESGAIGCASVLVTA